MARSDVNNAKSRVDSLRGALKSGATLTPQQQADRKSLTDLFGADAASDRSLGRMSSKLGAISNRIGEEGQGARVVFSNKSDGATYMRAPLYGFQIIVYPNYDPNRTDGYNAFAIRHEAGHLVGIDDKVLPPGAPSREISSSSGYIGKKLAYGLEAALWLGSHATDIAKGNNDNYQCFIGYCW